MLSFFYPWRCCWLLVSRRCRSLFPLSRVGSSHSFFLSFSLSFLSFQGDDDLRTRRGRGRNVWRTVAERVPRHSLRRSSCRRPSLRRPAPPDSVDGAAGGRPVWQQLRAAGGGPGFHPRPGKCVERRLSVSQRVGSSERQQLARHVLDPRR